MNNINLINASAGSGKTYNLTSRINDYIEDGVDPEHIMATTFTKRAAAELKERIRVELLKNNKAKEASRVNDSFIGTVNSVCDRLLREYAIEAGISPEVEVMPEEESDSIFKMSVDTVIGKYANTMEIPAKRMGLDGSGSGYQKNDDWRDHVKRIVDYARSNKMDSKSLRECSDNSWKSVKEILGQATKRDLDKEINDAVFFAIDEINQISQLKELTKQTHKELDVLKNFKRSIENDNVSWADWVKLSKLKPAKAEMDIVDNVITIANHVLSHLRLHWDIKQIIEGGFNCAIEALEYYDEYKKSRGIVDFIDQESKVLSMLENSESFSKAISERIDVVMVDEFQDTSPIQLSLFLAFNKVGGKSVWVGDPKQAIYGFRGTDPELMEQALSILGSSNVLEYSWRSKENLVNFTNALFSEVFSSMGRDKVCLSIPNEREEKAKGGDIELWHLIAKNNEQELQSIANGVRNLLSRKGIKPGDIAILCRSNNNCSTVASYLEQNGIDASASHGLLQNSKECKIALSALRYMYSEKDTLALVELIKFKSNESSEWFNKLTSDSKDTFDKWKSKSYISKLDEGRGNIKYWTPLEALEEAISRIDLLKDIKYRKNPSLAVSNLDALRGDCNKYMENCAFRGSGTSVGGFINYMQTSETKQAQGFGDETVNVLTYHGSKGLEWPWVVLADLDNSLRVDVFGVNIEAAKEFDMEAPLGNRKVRYWPWPFGAQRKFDKINNIVDGLPEMDGAIKKETYEMQRLMYVGMTRARDGLVMAVRKHSTKSSSTLKTSWLDLMKTEEGKKVVSLPLEADVGEDQGNLFENKQEIQVGSEMIGVSIFEYSEDVREGLYSTIEEDYLPEFQSQDVSYPKARLSPSMLEVTDETNDYTWNIISDFNSSIKINGKPQMDVLGNAIHTYLSANYKGLTFHEQVELADQVLNNWNMDTHIEPVEVCNAGTNLDKFIQNKYSDCKVFKEWPIFMRNEKNQVIQGFVDILLETDKGYVLIDHKNYPGGNSRERAKLYTPQMLAYKEAIERGTGKAVVEILIHMPVRGIVLALDV